MQATAHLGRNINISFHLLSFHLNVTRIVSGQRQLVTGAVPPIHLHVLLYNVHFTRSWT